ncbi:MAG: glutaredoxin family protein, partial [Syntrophaceae bacterium]|nr:glutaredoxin family protein [Syntrophaceae bacterium]
MLKRFLIFFAILFALQGIALADFYTWEDDQGNVHITDYPPPAKYGKKVKTSKVADTPREICIRPEKEKTSADKKEAIQDKNPEVILYTTSWCPYCTKARNFFLSRNIPFTEYDVEKDREAAA